jgi:hypothetical protein
MLDKEFLHQNGLPKVKIRLEEIVLPSMDARDVVVAYA